MPDLTPIVDDTSHYFTIAELRATNTSFADTTAYPTATLEAIRDGVEGDFEIEGNCAFVTRTATKTLSGDGGDTLFPPDTRLQSVTACTIDGTALTATELAAIVIDGRMLYREAGWARGSYNIAITYTHGYTECPRPVKEAALQVARDRLVPSGLPGNVTSQVVDGIDYRIQLTSERNPFGDPNVAVVLHRWGCARTWVG